MTYPFPKNATEVKISDADGLAVLKKVVAWLEEHSQDIQNHKYGVQMSPPIGGNFEARILYFKE